MCHLNAFAHPPSPFFKEQTVLPRAFLAHHSDPATQAPVIEKHRRSREGEQTFFTPRPPTLLRAVRLQAQVTGRAGGCHSPDALGARSRLGDATFAGHLPAEAGALLCQGKTTFVPIAFYQELFGPPGLFVLIARSQCTVTTATLLC